MKAIISNRYGSPDVLTLQEVEKPIPLENQVLVKIHATSLNFGNLVLLTGEPILARLAFGIRRPKYPIPGGDIAGVVEGIGANVTQFQLGDEVFGDLSSCGWGGFAEYVCVPEKAIVVKPTNLSFEEAAAVPMAGVTALQGLRKGNIKAGQKVLINGASGGVGTFSVQIAKSFGAEVTAVCSTRNVDIVRSIGADHVIDYKKDDFTTKLEKYDLILAVNGYHPISAYKRVMDSNGIFIHVGGSGNQMIQTLFQAFNKNLNIFLHSPNQKDLYFMKELIEAGKVKPIIDRSYKLTDVPDAFKYFQKGHAQGKVVITV